jgi:hypothetical protein
MKSYKEPISMDTGEDCAIENPMSDENQSIQKEWCDCANEAIQKGAQKAVNEAASVLKQNKIPFGNVVEIGPQWGFGLEQWTLHTELCEGLEVVQEFHQECLDRGLRCTLGAAENMDVDNLPFSKANFYLKDSAEHFVDRKKSFENIMDRLLDWIYISVPLEPWEPRDKAHFSKFSSSQEAQEIFKGMIPVFENIREPFVTRIQKEDLSFESNQITGRYIAIWKKPN